MVQKNKIKINTTEKAQQEPQDPWSLTLVTASTSLQSVALGKSGLPKIWKYSALFTMGLVPLCFLRRA